MAPDLSDLVQVEAELALMLQDREALGVGLHHAVFDAVVDHLCEVTGAGWADAAPASILGRRQDFKDRPLPFDDRFVAANHHAVSFGQTPHATAGTAVDGVDVLVRERFGP